ncbi:MAG TPA: hypothetical protein GX529_00190 [Firmicutes bacterium]|nr:hypothetical protein [Candidatus Fermentithermobacillaceae bacterium]
MKACAEEATSQTHILEPGNSRRLLQSIISHINPTAEPYSARNTLVVLRFISWFSVSLIYLASGNIPSIPFKLILVFGLLVEGLVAEYIYLAWVDDVTGLAALLAAETIGICVLLLPTGGLESPFAWYALNLVFAAASLLPQAWCYGISTSLMLSAIFGSYLVDHNFSLSNILRHKALILLVFVSLTIAADQIARLVRKLSEVCRDLERATELAESTANHTRALYQALEACSSQDNTKHLADLLASYAAKLTGSRAGFCILWESSGKPTASIYDEEMILPQVFQDLAAHECTTVCETQGPLCVLQALSDSPSISSENFMMIPLETSSINCGVLGYFSTDESLGNESRLKSLQFLSDLGAIAIERRQLEIISARLKVSEEQNRIANEIHDGVSQYLFGLTCGLHSLSTRNNHLQEADIQQELDLLKRTANHASRELRASIYRMSPLKRGKHLFISEVDSFVKDQAGLNKIRIAFTPTGSEDSVSPALRKALSRVIREATSNAIRHGKADDISISLDMAPHRVALNICDNGQGFNPGDQAKPEFEGIGLMSMRSLMDTFDGSFAIDSSPESGTKDSCVIPAEK